MIVIQEGRAGAFGDRNDGGGLKTGGSNTANERGVKNGGEDWC